VLVDVMPFKLNKNMMCSLITFFHKAALFRSMLMLSICLKYCLSKCSTEQFFQYIACSYFCDLAWHIDNKK